ncbi:hypothetical protein [Pseudaeromonas pectinilytica]
MHEHLDYAIVELCKSKIDLDVEETIFKQTFTLLNNTLGDKAFKKWDGQQFKGKFLISLFETISNGVQVNYNEITSIEPPEEQNNFILNKIKNLWSEQTFTNNSGAGVRGTTRLANLLPFSVAYFKP